LAFLFGERLFNAVRQEAHTALLAFAFWTESARL